MPQCSSAQDVVGDPLKEEEEDVRKTSRTREGMRADARVVPCCRAARSAGRIDTRLSFSRPPSSAAPLEGSHKSWRRDKVCNSYSSVTTKVVRHRFDFYVNRWRRTTSRKVTFSNICTTIGFSIIYFPFWNADESLTVWISVSSLFWEPPSWAQRRLDVEKGESNQFSVRARSLDTQTVCRRLPAGCSSLPGPPGRVKSGSLSLLKASCSFLSSACRAKRFTRRLDWERNCGRCISRASCRSEEECSGF